MTNGSQISVEQLKVASALTIASAYCGITVLLPPGRQRCYAAAAASVPPLQSCTSTNNELPQPCQERGPCHRAPASPPRGPPAAAPSACFLTSCYSGLRSAACRRAFRESDNAGAQPRAARPACVSGAVEMHPTRVGALKWGCCWREAPVKLEKSSKLLWVESSLFLCFHCDAPLIKLGHEIALRRSPSI